MPSDDAFRELAALAALGEITTSENGELMAHLRECLDCRDAYSDYSTILQQDLPRANPSRLMTYLSQLPRTTNIETRERFLARAQAHGAEFSADAAHQIVAGSRLRFSPRWTMAASAIAAGIVVTVALSALIHHSPPAKSAPPVMASTPVAPPRLPLPKLALDKEAPGSPDARLHQFEQENRELASAVKQRQAQLDEMQRSLTQLNSELTKERLESTMLTSAREQDGKQIEDLQKQVQKLESTNADSLADLVELQDRIRTLNASLQQQSQKVDMERQMASVSSDVRQLMGARDLHIIDVHDVNGAGRSAKSFGRVFYAEGQCLVFYAFDLPSGKPTPTKLYFNAWGQQEAEGRSVRNLGTFTIDDRDQQRWVLKVTDAKLLKGIDSVFVTAETVDDARQPEGQRVLYAYLAGIANHP